MEGSAIIGDQRRGPVGGLGIEVHGQERAARQDPLEDLARVPSPTKGAVEEDGARCGLKDLYCFF